MLDKLQLGEDAITYHHVPVQLLDEGNLLGIRLCVSAKRVDLGILIRLLNLVFFVSRLDMRDVVLAVVCHDCEEWAGQSWS